MSQTKAQLIEGTATQELALSKATLGAGVVGTPSLTTTGDTNTGIYFPAADTIGFTEGGVEAARIDSSGRLLVGTSSDRIGYKFQVEGTASSNGWGSFAHNSNDSTGAIFKLLKSRGTAVGSNTIVQSGDSLGRIDFDGADGSATNQTAASIRCDVDATPGAGDMPGRLVFSTCADGSASPTERMRIDSVGNVAIGATSYENNERLNVTGARNVFLSRFRNTQTSGAAYGIFIQYPNVSPNSTDSEFLRCDDSTTTRIGLRSNGGIANYSANNVNLSDRNAKKDIAPAAGTWDCLKEWEIVNFRYKDQPDDADLNMGVIAQQVAESCPEVITVFQEAKEATETEPAQEERLGVKDQQMMWMAIKALQEAQARIETLETEVATLKAS
jgi:hypothetical protein